MDAWTRSVEEGTQCRTMASDVSLLARCSWCLGCTTHTLKEKTLLGRDIFLCTACNNRTLPCKLCAVPSDRRSASSAKRSGSGSFSLNLNSSADSLGGAALLEEGMAQDGVWSEDHCLLCKEGLGCWPSPMDDDPSLARTGSGVLSGSPATSRMRGTTTLSHTQTRAAVPQEERRDIAAGEIQTLQLALLAAQRSMLVRVDNRTPHSMYLIDDVTQIEREGLAGGSWSPGGGPPPVIAPNQAVAFGTVSKGMGMGGTSARVGYEVRDEATQQRVAAVQLRWVNPLVKVGSPQAHACLSCCTAVASHAGLHLKLGLHIRFREIKRTGARPGRTFRRRWGRR